MPLPESVIATTTCSSMARAVVDRHDGSLTFESVVGPGTTFFIRLPIAGPGSAPSAPVL
jgi:light-regulated signal transduction histidine kinase (bacteriophytochrome)